MLGRPISTPCAIVFDRDKIRLRAQAGEQADQRDVSGAGRRILGNVEVRREHPGPDIDITLMDLGVEHDADGRLLADFQAEHIAVRACPDQRGAALQFGENERRAAGRDTRAMMDGLDVGQRDSASRCHQFAGNLRTHRKRLRGGKFRAHHERTFPQNFDRDQAGLFLEDDAIAADGPAVAGAGAGQYESGADIGMAGERHLATRREYPHFGRMRGVPGRQHEGRLCQIELGGDGLHLPGRQPLGVEDNGQRIADELRAGEYIDGLKLQAHRTLSKAAALIASEPRL